LTEAVFAFLRLLTFGEPYVFDFSLMRNISLRIGFRIAFRTSRFVRLVEGTEADSVLQHRFEDLIDTRPGRDASDVLILDSLDARQIDEEKRIRLRAVLLARNVLQHRTAFIVALEQDGVVEVCTLGYALELAIHACVSRA
jgi:hypothetical protein